MATTKNCNIIDCTRPLYVPVLDYMYNKGDIIYYCHEHTCTCLGCVNNRDNNSEYCKKHSKFILYGNNSQRNIKKYYGDCTFTCTYINCKNPVKNDVSCCDEYECDIYLCRRSIKYNFICCDEHKCDRYLCNNVKVENCGACIEHNDLGCKIDKII